MYAVDTTADQGIYVPNSQNQIVVKGPTVTLVETIAVGIRTQQTSGIWKHVKEFIPFVDGKTYVCSTKNHTRIGIGTRG